jgi:hypothetical protein
MLMPTQQNSCTHVRVLLALTDRGILAEIVTVLWFSESYWYSLTAAFWLK